MTRPFIICHMCTSIDGKILGHRWFKLPGGKAGAMLFEPTAASFGIGAWIVGTTTMKEFQGRPMKLPSPKTPFRSGDFIASLNAKTYAIGVDAKAVLRFQKNQIAGDHVILLITHRASHPYRAHLRKAGVSYLICGKTRVDLPLALNKLHKKFGLKKLMLQGGGTFNGSMLQAHLVDEISHVVVPIVDAGGPTIPGLFDTPGKPPREAVASLREISHKKLKGGVHWYRYRIIYGASR
jgi:riboflavin biosynthesis pyrimidine reductase